MPRSFRSSQQSRVPAAAIANTPGASKKAARIKLKRHPSQPASWQHGRVTSPSDSGVVAETDRIVIRPWRPEEADRLFDLLRRMEVARWIGGRPMTDREEALVRIERWGEMLAADPRFGAWAAVERCSGIPAGTVLLKPLPDGGGEIEIGWHFHPDSWGKGLASEAAGALRARGFAQGLDEVWAVTHLDNHPSIAVCRRIGLQLLGVTHRWYPEPSMMFWAGARDAQEPSIAPDGPAPPW